MSEEIGKIPCGKLMRSHGREKESKCWSDEGLSSGDIIFFRLP